MLLILWQGNPPVSLSADELGEARRRVSLFEVSRTLSLISEARVLSATPDDSLLFEADRRALLLQSPRRTFISDGNMQFSDKKQGETITIGFDVYHLMQQPGELPVSASFVVSVVSGSDAAAGSMVTGYPFISDTKVMTKVQAGLPGVTYQLEGSVTTSTGNVLIERGQFAVVA